MKRRSVCLLLGLCLVLSGVVAHAETTGISDYECWIQWRIGKSKVRSGYARFYPSRQNVVFNVTNKGERSLDFEGAEYYLEAKGGSRHKLMLDKITTTDPPKLDEPNVYVCYPGYDIEITCFVNFAAFPKNFEIDRFRIELKDGQKIVFPV